MTDVESGSPLGLDFYLTRALIEYWVCLSGQVLKSPEHNQNMSHEQRCCQLELGWDGFYGHLLRS